MLWKKKSNSSKINSSNSLSENSSLINNKIITNSTSEKILQINENRNFIKLILTIRPNTLEHSKLLTITFIDYSEVLNENQLKDIIQYLFNNLFVILQKSVAITKNCESIIVNANINLVYNFWANWRTHLVGEDIVKDVKFNGDPKIPGNSLELTYLNKYRLIAITEEANSFIQEGNEDDNNEWNFKYKLCVPEGQGEYFNNVFVSCENGSKTWVSVENDINERIGIDKLQELSKRKLYILNAMKNYIEKNIELLNSLSNDDYKYGIL
jgi:hypothetical protein